MRSGGEGRRLATSLAIAASALGCGNAPDDTRPLAPLDAGVGRVEVVWWDTSGAQRTRAFGTAFLVGSQGELLTAGHVAANARTERANHGREARILVTFAPEHPEPGSGGDGLHSVEIAIAAEDPAADLALLRIAEPLAQGNGEGRGSEGPRSGLSRPSSARLAWAEPPPESAVALAGYPIGEPRVVIRTGRLLDPAVLKDSPTAPRPLPGWIAELLRDGAILVADVETKLGNSGAPVYRAETGEIIGLCSALIARIDRPQGELIPLPHPPGDPITVIIAARRIHRFLDAHRVAGY